MEHSVIVLVALVLLIVFAGFQFQKLVVLFRKESDVKSDPVPLKKVVIAEEVNLSQQEKKVKTKTKKAKTAAEKTKTVGKKTAKKTTAI